MLRSLLTTIIGTTIALAGIGAWCYIGNTPGTWWLAAIAFFGALGLLDSLGKVTLRLGASLVVAVAAGAAWYLCKSYPDSMFMGLLGIFAAFQAIHALQRMAQANTK